VQRGAFGACLMAEPTLVRDCVAAMRDAVDLPVTVKHRIGIDRGESYGFVRDFVGTVAAGGCSLFIVHARNAWLQGLSPKENREVPPLRPEVVGQLQRDFPDLGFVLNGGVTSAGQIADHLRTVTGVMVGREAYHRPWSMAPWDVDWLGAASAAASERESVEEAMVRYMEREASKRGTPWPSIARHMIGLYHGTPGARRWRQVWSSHQLKALPPRLVSRRATAARRTGDGERQVA
jgi:tRNA-dihydrouridine synthase A